jgi:hypothetical protein
MESVTLCFAIRRNHAPVVSWIAGVCIAGSKPGDRQTGAQICLRKALVWVGRRWHAFRIWAEGRISAAITHRGVRIISVPPESSH